MSSSETNRQTVKFRAHKGDILPGFSTATLPSGVVTFLFTDVEGSTARWEAHRDIMAQTMLRHNQILQEIITAQGGFVFEIVGDEFCSVFQEATAALKASVAIHQKLDDEKWAAAIAPLRVRAALYTATDIQVQPGNRYDSFFLNRIARLLSVANGGQTLLTGLTAELARPHLPNPIQLEDLGEHHLRDLAQPEHIFQLVGPQLVSTPVSELRGLPKKVQPAHNLPVATTSFIGREREIAEIKSLLTENKTGRLLTLLGSGGAGKTRLALKVGWDLLENFSEGVWLVELAPIAESALVLQALVETLGLHEEAGRSLQTTLLNHLRNRNLLLIIDNCEHLIDTVASLSETLLKSCSNLKILATSREALNILGEQTWRIPSLSLPPNLNLKRLPPLATLSRYEAIQLFIDRVKTTQPHFNLSTQNAAAIVQICTSLDGIPLALELAAVRVKSLGVEQVAEKLNDRFLLLTGGSRTALPRQKTLRALIDWSYDLLAEKEQLLLNRLSVFAGGWTLEAAEKICAGENLEIYEVADLLEQLSNKSLVLPEEIEGNVIRYRMLETIREYAREKTNTLNETAQLRRQHLFYYAKLAETVAPKIRGLSQSAELELLEIERDNWRAALSWSLRTRVSDDNSTLQAQEIESGLRLGASLGEFWDIRGYFNEGRELLSQLQRQARETNFGAANTSYAWAALWEGRLCYRQGDFVAGSILLQESISIFEEQSDKNGLAFASMLQGDLAAIQGEYGEAARYLQESLLYFRELNDNAGLAEALACQADLAFNQGKYKEAARYLHESQTHSQEVADKNTKFITLNAKTESQNEYDIAVNYLEERLNHFRELDDKWGVANTLKRLGNVAYNQGNFSTATQYYEESLELFRASDIQRGIADVLLGQGNLATRLGNYRAATTYYYESLKLLRLMGNRNGICQVLTGMGIVLYHLAPQTNSLTEDVKLPELLARLYGAIASSLNQTETPYDQVLVKEFDEIIQKIQTKLGQEIFKNIATTGQMMHLEEIIGYIFNS